MEIAATVFAMLEEIPLTHTPTAILAGIMLLAYRDCRKDRDALWAQLTGQPFPPTKRKIFPRRDN